MLRLQRRAPWQAGHSLFIACGPLFLSSHTIFDRRRDPYEKSHLFFTSKKQMAFFIRIPPPVKNGVGRQKERATGYKQTMARLPRRSALQPQQPAACRYLLKSSIALTTLGSRAAVKEDQEEPPRKLSSAAQNACDAALIP